MEQQRDGIRMKKLVALFLGLAAPFAAPVEAHEFWLEPLAYQVSSDGSLQAEIVNGQKFAGVKLAYLNQRILRYEAWLGDTVKEITMRNGDTPGLQTEPVGDGLNVVVYQSSVSTVSYESWEKFQSFVEHKDLPATHEAHLAAGFPDADFKEAYARFSKTLIGVGDAAGSDARRGLETELVALSNPYVDDLTEGFKVQLFYQFDPRPDTQIEVFDKSPDGVVTVTTTRTDANGIASVPVTAGHSYMLDSVYLRAPAPDLAAETGAIYETLWANLTFGVPND